MSEEEFDRAIEIGVELVDDCVTNGCQVLCIGEMGIANTSPSSIWMSIFGQIPLNDCIGAGAGLDAPGIRHKCDVLNRALANSHCESTQEVLRYFGGFEMITAIGAMLRAAEQRLVVLVDGFIMTACALGACRLYPEAQLGEGTGALCAFPIVDSAVRMVNEMNNFDNAKITKYF